MIKAVIFDYGGVVMDKGFSFYRDIAFTYKVPKKLVIQKIKLPLKLYRKGIISENQFWKKFSLSLKKSIPMNKKELWRKNYKDSFFIYPEITNFIKKLKKRGIKTAVLSNTIKPHVEIINKRGGYKNFDVVILSCKVHLAKPDLKIYLLTVKRLGVKPRECIFIDDEGKNLKPARRLGMKTVLAKKPKQVINDISRILDF